MTETPSEQNDDVQEDLPSEENKEDTGEATPEEREPKEEVPKEEEPKEEEPKEEEPKEEEPKEEEPKEEEPKEVKPKEKKEKKKKKKEKTITDDDVGVTSLGLGPSEYIKPQVVAPAPETVEMVPLTELTPEEEDFGMTIFAIKTAIGHEKMVADRIMSKARKRELKVFSALSPTKLRGYVLLEAVNNRDAVKELLKGLEHVRNVVEGETTLDEIEHFLTPKPLVFGIMEGDIVEIISGPFKGEKAKVQQIDESKEEITVELFEAMVSIPVTIRGDHVRVLEKESG